MVEKKEEVKEPVVLEPVIKGFVVKEPVVEEPVVEEPVVEEPVVSVGKGKLVGLNVAQPNNEPNKDGYVGVDPVPVRANRIDQP